LRKTHPHPRFNPSCITFESVSHLGLQERRFEGIKKIDGPEDYPVGLGRLLPAAYQGDERVRRSTTGRLAFATIVLGQRFCFGQRIGYFMVAL
jgi:hypothetical protein